MHRRQLDDLLRLPEQVSSLPMEHEEERADGEEAGRARLPEPGGIPPRTADDAPHAEQPDRQGRDQVQCRDRRGDLSAREPDRHERRHAADPKSEHRSADDGALERPTRTHQAQAERHDDELGEEEKNRHKLQLRRPHQDRDGDHEEPHDKATQRLQPDHHQ